MMDVSQCFENMLTVDMLVDAGYYTQQEADEFILAFKTLALRYTNQLLEGGRDTEDDFNVADHEL